MISMSGPQMAFEEYEARLSAARARIAELESEREDKLQSTVARVLAREPEPGGIGDLHADIAVLRSENHTLRDELARVKLENKQLAERLHVTGLMHTSAMKMATDAEDKLAAAVAERDELKERNDRQAETLKLVGPYPHMCRTDHIQIGFAGEYREGDERCPVCILESERDELRRSLGEAVDALRPFGDIAKKSTVFTGSRAIYERAAALVARKEK